MPGVAPAGLAVILINDQEVLEGLTSKEVFTYRDLF